MAFPPLPVSPQRLQSLKCSYLHNPVSLWPSFFCVYGAPLWYKWSWHQTFYYKFRVKKDWEHFSARVCLQSSVSSAEVLVLSTLNLSIESGCPKGEAQFALQDTLHFPWAFNKESNLAQCLYFQKPRLTSGKCRSYAGPKLHQGRVKWFNSAVCKAAREISRKYSLSDSLQSTSIPFGLRCQGLY